MAFFSVEVAFSTPKDINLELGLESPKVLYLGVVVDVNQESGHITKGKLDMSIRFGMVKGVTKGLFIGKSKGYYILSYCCSMCCMYILLLPGCVETSGYCWYVLCVWEGVGE